MLGDRQPVLLRNATLDDGRVVDVTIVDDRISAVTPASDAVAGDRSSVKATARQSVTDASASTESAVIDLRGMLLLPAPAEPHAHLDKALTADVVANPQGDLGGAIAAWSAYRTTITHQDFVERATTAARLAVANGCTALRTHVDVGADIGTTGVEALLQVKADLAAIIDIQLVCLNGGFTGVDGAAQLAAVRSALDLGVDVVGGVPHIESDPARAIDLALELAGEYDRPIDLHADETLDADSADLQTLAERILATGFSNGAVASHCVALGMKGADQQGKIAELAAAAGVAVVALPQTNLYLQARGVETAAPRGLTALAALERAGATVAGGGDNLRDPFCLVGRGDPMETASLLVMAGHLLPAAAYRAVSAGARAAMGLEAVTVTVGAPAELVAIPAESVGEAVATGPAGRVVIRQGRVVSEGP